MKILIAFFMQVAVLHGTVVLKDYPGQLGNIFFALAAGVSLAQDNHSPISLPQIIQGNNPNFFPFQRGSAVQDYFKVVYDRIFSAIPLDSRRFFRTKVYDYGSPIYAPIPYQPNMEIKGYFQCEKYFKHNSDLIHRCFGISQPIETYLLKNFAEIISHPKTVGIHVRTAYTEWKRSGFPPDFYTCWLAPDMEFFRRAIESFDEDSLFVVCSDRPDWCKKNFQVFNRKFIFVENQEFIYDFFLLTKCKDLIIAASTFGWWAAYLNENPEKKVLYRNPFLSANMDQINNIHFKVPEWTAIDMPPAWPPIPIFEDYEI